MYIMYSVYPSTCLSLSPVFCLHSLTAFLSHLNVRVQTGIGLSKGVIEFLRQTNENVYLSFR